MRLFIPPIATKMVLTQPWTFTLYMEDRNNKFISELLKNKWNIKSPSKDADGYHRCTYTAVELCPCTLPEGTLLSMDRIYIRKGNKDFDSISFHVWIEKFDSERGKSVKIKGRFWVKLADANKIHMTIGEGIPIGSDGLCTCSCADPCPLGKVGSTMRCTEEELNAAGFTTKKV